MKCICHSLALCIQYAVSKLPSNIGFLLAEIPAWFRQSPTRREAYKNLYQVMNTSDSEEIPYAAPLPFEKPCTTRWLVCGKVMFKILMNWEELKAYFVTCETVETKFDVKYKARLLKEILFDYKNFLYFHFCTPIVQEFERFNSLFQKSKADPRELNDELFVHYKSLKSRIYDINDQKKVITLIDFGAKFEAECSNFLQKRPNKTETLQEILSVKERCLTMLDEALLQIEKRLTSVRSIFKDLANLGRDVVLNQLTRPLFSQLPFQHLAEGNLPTIEEQN